MMPNQIRISPKCVTLLVNFIRNWIFADFRVMTNFILAGEKCIIKVKEVSHRTLLNHLNETS